MLQTLLTSIAIILRILSNPLANVFQKQLTAKGAHPLGVNFATYLLLSLCCIFIALPMRWNELPAAFWRYSVLGGIAGAVGNAFLVKALQKGDLSVLGPINAYKSVVGLIFGIFLLGELPNLWGIAGITLIIWGSYFVLHTKAEKFSLALFKKPEIQHRIWAMILTAIEAVFIKKIILLSSVVIAFISWCWAGALAAFFFMLLQKGNIGSLQMPSFRSGYKYLLLAFCIGVMQYTTTYVFEHVPVGYALSLFQLSAVVSVLAGWAVFGETGIRKKLIGSVIMIAGSVIIILGK